MAINENAVYNFSIYAKGLDGYTGPVFVTLDNDNILGAAEDVSLESFEIDGVSDHFTYTVPMYSVTVIRIPRNK